MFQTLSDKPIQVVTSINGQKETFNMANRGDVIITGPLGERYIISPFKFTTLYNIINGYAVPRLVKKQVAKYTVEISRKLNLPVSFKFKAPWGEDMLLNTGDYIVNDNGKFYRIEQSVFKKTYQ
jgi:hypothetical protein